jgi:hypothetical protein
MKCRTLLMGHHSSHLVPWGASSGDEILNKLWPHNHVGAVADSYSSRHLSQVGSSVSPSLKWCPFRWQCPVNSPTTHLNWSLFNFNRSFVLLVEGSGISPFACFESSCALNKDDEMGEDELVRACSTHGRYENCMQNFILKTNRRTLSEETLWRSIF